MARPDLSTLTWADVEVLAPQLAAASIPVARQTLILAMVMARIDQATWGDLAFDGGLWLAAYLADVSRQGARGSGPVSSRSAGPVSESIAVPSDWEGGLAVNAYGREYLRLRRAALGFVGFAA